MPSFTSVEISLYRRDAGNAGCGIELRFTAADSEKEKIASGTTPLHADDPEFRVRSLDPAVYGGYLAGQLLAEPAMRDFFDQAVAAAQSRDAALHIRLRIDRGVAELAQPALGDAPPARSDFTPADRGEPDLLPLPG